MDMPIMRGAETSGKAAAVAAKLDPLSRLCGGICLDYLHRSVKFLDCSHEDVYLTEAPFCLLHGLVEAYPQVATRNNLWRLLWGVDEDRSTNRLDVLVNALRKRIGAERIVHVWKVGYRLQV